MRPLFVLIVTLMLALQACTQTRSLTALQLSPFMADLVDDSSPVDGDWSAYTLPGYHHQTMRVTSTRTRAVKIVESGTTTDVGPPSRSTTKAVLDHGVLEVEVDPSFNLPHKSVTYVLISWRGANYLVWLGNAQMVKDADSLDRYLQKNGWAYRRKAA